MKYAYLEGFLLLSCDPSVNDRILMYCIHVLILNSTHTLYLTEGSLWDLIELKSQHPPTHVKRVGRGEPFVSIAMIFQKTFSLHFCFSEVTQQFLFFLSLSRQYTQLTKVFALISGPPTSALIRGQL